VHKFHNELVVKIASFLEEIGIAVEQGSVNDGAFLPGIEVVNGGLVVDELKLLSPGDLLHEAGHLAVAPPDIRNKLSGQVEIPKADLNAIESAAMCWSYAACVHLQIDPRVVFHEHGYHGHSENLLLNFELGVFPGVHELVSARMTGTAGEPAGLPIFPLMGKWMRD
jgi:hypothetical protein